MVIINFPAAAFSRYSHLIISFSSISIQTRLCISPSDTTKRQVKTFLLSLNVHMRDPFYWDSAKVVVITPLKQVAQGRVNKTAKYTIISEQEKQVYLFFHHHHSLFCYSQKSFFPRMLLVFFLFWWKSLFWWYELVKSTSSKTWFSIQSSIITTTPKEYTLILSCPSEATYIIHFVIDVEILNHVLSFLYE